MRTATDVLDQQVLEMRWRCLSLAADLDRIGRADGGPQVLATDPRVQQLRQALHLLLGDAPDRAAAVQMAFSDLTPLPERRER